jgi:hypothetical protein
MEIYFQGRPGNPEERIPRQGLSDRWQAERTLNPSEFAVGKSSAALHMSSSSEQDEQKVASRAGPDC